MSIQVETKDCTALGDAELAELADLCAEGPLPYEIGLLSKQAEAWVLVTQVRENDKLKGFAFSHARAHRRHPVGAHRPGVGQADRQARHRAAGDHAGRAAPGRAGLPRRGRPHRHPLHHAVRASRPSRRSTTSCPAPTTRRRGEERAWGRRLAKRFGVEAAAYDDRSFTAKGNGSHPEVFDHESLKPESDPGRRRRLLQGLRRQAGRLARRLRLGHGRRPRQARLVPVAPGGARSGGRPPSADGASLHGRADRPGRSTGSSTSRGVPRRPVTARAWAFVVLEGEQTARYWDVALPADRRAAFRWPGLVAAPVLIVVLVRPGGVGRALRRARQGRAPASAAAQGTGPCPTGGSTPAWPSSTCCSAPSTPGCGACFFGLFDHEADVLAALGVPDGWRAVGTVALGHPAPDEPGRSAAPRPPVRSTRSSTAAAGSEVVGDAGAPPLGRLAAAEAKPPATRAEREGDAHARPGATSLHQPPPARPPGRDKPSYYPPAVADLTNRRVLLAQRPEGLVREEDFSHDEVARARARARARCS